MTERKVPVQSLIDHIKTAVDVDPWAKDMAEDLLKEKEQEAEAWVMSAIADKDKTGCVLDMRPLVFCKDCRYLSEDTRICILGIPHGYIDTWFCAYGKRR